ncbi:hypothetical protein [Flavobacterium sp. 25HG05S-40]|uniref:hypothetical protein n=1 Tax=Flavobacterium sp. 25HG05S-40 TaxID=3458682 RepID=UPI004043D1CF
MGKRWNDDDLVNLKNKGFKVDEQIKINTDIVMSHLKPPPIKVEKISIEKNAIGFILKSFHQHDIIPYYVTEHQFDEKRKYRFDWAIPSLKLAIEYEGIFSDKSGHTTVGGYTKDVKKYNLATVQGWKILRYTALNYSDLAQDIELFLSNL